MRVENEIREQLAPLQVLALERDRIAAGLHDDIQQRLFTIGLQLGTLLEGDLAPDVAGRIDAIRRLAARTADELRDVIFALEAPHGDEEDFTASVRCLLAECSALGLEADLVVTGMPGAAVALVRGVAHAVVRQALANVGRHAQASMVLVSIRYAPDRLDVVIQDDGVGASDVVVDNFGLRSMRRRVEALGGSLEIANGDECGFTVRVSMPLLAPDP